MSAIFAETAPVEVTEELVATLVETGGYTHPLFNPAPGTPRPLPGQAVLLLAGGLVEQCGVLDRAVAMLEIREVRFARMVFPGTSLRVRVEGVEARATRSGRELHQLRWLVLDEADEEVADATVLMLMEPADPSRSA